MAGTNQYTNYPCVIGAGTPFNLLQIGTGNWSGGQSEDVIQPAGLHRRDAVIVNSHAPMIQFDTTDITTVLSNITNIQRGLACPTGVDLYYQQRSSGAIFESGSAHLHVNATLGHILLDSISVSGVGPAQANLTFHELWDGTNAMSAPAAAQALGASAPAFTSQFYRGTATVGGTAIDNISDVSIDFGIQVDKTIYGGAIGPTQLTVVSANPVITITTDDLAEFPSKVVNSYGQTYSTLIVYLKKGASGGLRGGAGTALSVTSSAGFVTGREIRGGGVGNSSFVLTFMPTADLSFSLSATHP